MPKRKTTKNAMMPARASRGLLRVHGTIGRDAMIRLIRLAVLDMPARQRPRPPAGAAMTETAYFMSAQER
jgi:hypothetical protein